MSTGPMSLSHLPSVMPEIIKSAEMVGSYLQMARELAIKEPNGQSKRDAITKYFDPVVTELFKPPMDQGTQEAIQRRLERTIKEPSTSDDEIDFEITTKPTIVLSNVKLRPLAELLHATLDSTEIINSDSLIPFDGGIMFDFEDKLFVFNEINLTGSAQDFSFTLNISSPHQGTDPIVIKSTEIKHEPGAEDILSLTIKLVRNLLQRSKATN